MRPLGGAAAALLAVAACAHTRTVEPEVEGHETPPHDTGASRAHSPAPGWTSAARESPPLPTSPAGLLEPEAARKIQQHLVRDGLLGVEQATGEMNAATHAALARFQRAHDLPATGDPDAETVHRLGLAPADVFRSGTGGP
jgi:hypothetical protein